MRTTIDLPDELFREAKTRAVRQGTTLKNLVTQLIRSGLQAPSHGADFRPVHRNPPPVAIKRAPGQSTLPARTNRQLYAMLEEQEIHCAQGAQNTPNDLP